MSGEAGETSRHNDEENGVQRWEAVPNQDALLVRVAEHPDQLPEPGWNDLCEPGDYFTIDYLRALARAGLDCSFRYFVVQQGQRVVGLAFGYFLRFPLLGPWRPLLFVSGSPVNFGFPFALRAGEQNDQVFFCLVQTMIAEARKKRAAALVVRDLFSTGSGPGQSQALQNLGFRQKPLFQRAWLDILWPTFADYLAGLRSSRRRSILKEMRRVAGGGYRLVVTKGEISQDYLADMARLCRYLCLKYKDRDQLPLPESFFRAMTRVPECVAFLLLRRERLAAFGLVFERGSLLETGYCGIDPALTGKDPAHRYIEYEVIRYAISHGCQAIDFGISNEVNKMRLGCRLQNLSGALRPLSALSTVLIRLHLDRWLLPEYRFKVAADRAENASFDRVGASAVPSASLREESQ